MISLLDRHSNASQAKLKLLRQVAIKLANNAREWEEEKEEDRHRVAVAAFHAPSTSD